MRLRSILGALLASCGVALLTTPPARALEDVEPTPVPETVFSTMDGEETLLDDMIGEVIVLNFWATWCAPCKREMPSLARLDEELSGDEAIVLTIAVDRAPPIAVQKFLDEAGAAELLTWRDPDQASMRDFALDGLPTTFIIDKDGLIVARHLGLEVWDRPEIVKRVRELARRDEDGENLPRVEAAMLTDDLRH
ncbi:MAG: TlpA family protein disulfide reductase [Geminicoccaceae bacterium]|nr:TlpA family protein disulfide reductase [Geminicoccaceae bacterium]